jgi:hypothetical protein
MGTSAAQTHGADTPQLSPATKIQSPKPTMSAEITWATAFSMSNGTGKLIVLYDSTGIKTFQSPRKAGLSDPLLLARYRLRLARYSRRISIARHDLQAVHRL